MPSKSIEDLNQWYKQAEEADKKTFAEQRSAVLLVAGEHYQKTGKQYLDRIRTSRELASDIKIRLTKNHTQKIVKLFVNNIMSQAPGVSVKPQIDTELQDQKAAELHQAVWEHIKAVNNIDETGKILDWADDFCTIAEVCTKIYFDPDAGDITGYEQAVDEQGNPLFQTQDGQTITENELAIAKMAGMQIQAEPKPDESRPIKTGEIKLEDYHGFNVLRDPTAKTMDESPVICLRKMSKIKELKKMFPDHADKIEATEDKTFLVFDSGNYGYRPSDKTEALVKEFYYKPNSEYPNGYYYICTEDAILDEGELPFGLFPVVFETFDRAATTPRGIGIVKTLRPYQIEINRTASKVAEHQMTLGDDKLITVNGATMSAGGTLPGVREIKVTGQPPIVLNGRSGDQFVDWMLNQIQEMYQVCGLEESMQKNSDGQYDVYSMLYQAARKKKFMQRHVAKFEKYLKKVCETCLDFARHYMSDDAVIFAVGRREQVNIKEFKKAGKLYYQIKVEPQTADIESLMGKQIVASQIMQFVGSKLSERDIGKLIKNMPFANFDESFNDFTIDYENAKNLMLALERGELPEINQSDKPDYMMEKLNHRMKQSDFKFLNPYIQSNYKMKFDEYAQMQEEQKQKLLSEQAGMIPASGPLIPCDMYVQSSPDDPMKTRRVRIPNSSLMHLLKTLQAQGEYVEQVEINMSPEARAMAADATGTSSLQPPEGQQETIVQPAFDTSF